MNEKKSNQEAEERLQLTTRDLRTTIRVLEALATGGVHEFLGPHYPTVAQNKMKLCICDLVIKSFFVKKADVNQYFFDMGENTVFNTKRDGSFTICNQSSSKIRLTFYTDNKGTTWGTVADELVLQLLPDGPPYVDIEANGCATIETSNSKEGANTTEVWINIEEETTAGWRTAKGGGNGPEMEIDDP